jgi:hypothetical protein
MLVQRLLDKAYLGETIWRIGIDADPTALVQLIARGEGKRFLAVQVREERQTIQPVEDPAIGTILLLAGIGLATGEEPSLPLQQEQLRLWMRPDRWP